MSDTIVVGRHGEGEGVRSDSMSDSLMVGCPTSYQRRERCAPWSECKDPSSTPPSPPGSFNPSS